MGSFMEGMSSLMSRPFKIVVVVRADSEFAAGFSEFVYPKM